MNIAIPVKCPHCGHLQAVSPEKRGQMFANCDSEEGGCGETFACMISDLADADTGSVTVTAVAGRISYRTAISEVVDRLMKMAIEAPSAFDMFTDYSGHVKAFDVRVYNAGRSGRDDDAEDLLINRSVYLDRDNAVESLAEVDDIQAGLTRTVKEFGDVLASIGAALDPDGPGGTKITRKELMCAEREINEQVCQVMALLQKLKDVAEG